LGIKLRAEERKRLSDMQTEEYANRERGERRKVGWERKERQSRDGREEATD
jgi:hypothetical protein